MGLFRDLKYDIRAILERDPAARNSAEVFFPLFRISRSDLSSDCAVVLPPSYEIYRPFLLSVV